MGTGIDRHTMMRFRAWTAAKEAMNKLREYAQEAEESGDFGDDEVDALDAYRKLSEFDHRMQQD